MPIDTATATIANNFPSLHQGNNNVALLVGSNSHTYSELDSRINTFSQGLAGNLNDLEEERVAFLIPGSLDYVTTLLGIWRAGGIAVPLNIHSAQPELEHALSCAGVSRIVVNAEHRQMVEALGDALNITLISVDEILQQQIQKPSQKATGFEAPQLSDHRRALILFTSGTTNKPKGVVTTHGNLRSQITTLVQAWAWDASDRIPLFLPLHHVHGIINVLCCGLWVGAGVDVFEQFERDTILERIAAKQYSVFMAVPTVYAKIIQHLDASPSDQVAAICAGFASMRLNISGSAACPIPIYRRWLELTDQTLLERYGMTEIGMGISNPYDGERRAGAVGLPLPGVEVALFDENNEIVEDEDNSGEIRIKGASVFLEYWGNAKATSETFHEGWFCTGDIAVVENGYYRIMGRSSIDIIKSGGYKLSALEIEGVLLNHDDIDECAVIGIPDDTWGESVVAFLVLRGGTTLSLKQLKHWCKERMSSYKIPKQIQMLESLPRNAMGKVTKKSLKNLVS